MVAASQALDSARMLTSSSDPSSPGAPVGGLADMPVAVASVWEAVVGAPPDEALGRVWYPEPPVDGLPASGAGAEAGVGCDGAPAPESPLGTAVGLP